MSGGPRRQGMPCEGCEQVFVHQDVLRSAREKMKQDASDENMARLASLLRVFGDPTRIRLICALYHEEMCVCDLSELLGMTQSAISHQLRVLKDARVVKSRREGKMVFYALHDVHIMRIFDQAMVHILEREG